MYTRSRYLLEVSQGKFKHVSWLVQWTSDVMRNMCRWETMPLL